MSVSVQHNLGALLAQHAAEAPDRVSLIEVAPDGSERKMTYGELHLAVARFAAVLERRGLGAGARAIVFVPMSIELYVVLLGLFHRGAVAVFIDPGMGRAQINAALALAEADAFVAIPKAQWLRFILWPLWRMTRLSIDAQRLPGVLHGHEPRPVEPVEVEHPALLTFTSGTTGAPKGAMRSHRFLLAQHHALTGVMNTTVHDVEMPALPIFLLNTLAVGATAVIPPVGRRVADADGALLARTIERHGVTTCAASPALYETMVPHLSADACHSVRAFFLGGAPVRPGLLAALAPHLPNGDTVVVYGSTEAEPISEITGTEVLANTAAETAAGAGLCVGPPAACVSVRIDGEPAIGGEVLVAGDHVNETYYRNPEAVAENKVRDVDGTVWHRTGDIARVDSQGRLWLLGRKSAVVERSGKHIYPFAIEMAARARTGVEQAALVEHDGRVLLVVQGAEAAVTDLVGEATGVDAVLRIEAMPTDPRHNAKIDYTRLRRWLKRHG